MSQPRDLGSTRAWDRSQTRSQERRITAARRRLWKFRSRTTAIVLSIATLGFGGVAVAASTSGSASGGASQSAMLKAVQKELGVKADGRTDAITRRAVRKAQRKAGISVDGIVGPQTVKALGVTVPGSSSSSSSSSTRSAGGASSTLETIAQCESGGDPTAVSSSGQYRGKYQFDRQTWQAHGGSGDPAAAPESEQDRIAQELYDARGTQPWPVCGKGA